MALDTLLIATEFGDKDKIYELIAKIYKILGNLELSKKISNPETRLTAINTLDDLFEGEHLNAVKFFFNKKGGNLGAFLST